MQFRVRSSYKYAEIWGMLTPNVGLALVGSSPPPPPKQLLDPELKLFEGSPVNPNGNRISIRISIRISLRYSYSYSYS